MKINIEFKDDKAVFESLIFNLSFNFDKKSIARKLY